MLQHVLLAVVVLMLLGGCTTIRSVGGGNGPDDFYLVISKGLYPFTMQHVLHCDRVSETTPVECVRVARRAQVGAFVRNPADELYEKCADQANIDWYDQDEPHLDAAVAKHARDADVLGTRACRQGYADAWNASARQWNASPDREGAPAPLVELSPSGSPTTTGRPDE